MNHGWVSQPVNSLLGGNQAPISLTQFGRREARGAAVFRYFVFLIFFCPVFFLWEQRHGFPLNFVLFWLLVWGHVRNGSHEDGSVMSFSSGRRLISLCGYAKFDLLLKTEPFKNLMGNTPVKPVWKWKKCVCVCVWRGGFGPDTLIHFTLTFAIMQN